MYGRFGGESLCYGDLKDYFPPVEESVTNLLPEQQMGDTSGELEGLPDGQPVVVKYPVNNVIPVDP